MKKKTVVIGTPYPVQLPTVTFCHNSIKIPRSLKTFYFKSIQWITITYTYPLLNHRPK